MSQYYLGFDAGTQSVKVAVYDENMNCIVSSSAPTTLTSKNFVAPSPSLAINLARSCAQVTKASKKPDNLDVPLKI